MTQNDDGRDRKVTVKLPRDVIDNWMGSCEPANEAERTLAGMLIEAVQAHEAWLKNQADVAAHGQLCDYCEGVGILEAGSDGSDCPVCGGTGRVANTGQGQDRLKDLELGLGTFSGWVKRLHSTMGEVLNRHGETLNGLSEHIVNLHERFERTDEVIYELRKVLDGLTGHVVNMNDKLMGEIIDCADDASRDARVFDEKLDGMAEHIVNASLRTSS